MYLCLLVQNLGYFSIKDKLLSSTDAQEEVASDGWLTFPLLLQAVARCKGPLKCILNIQICRNTAFTTPIIMAPERKLLTLIIQLLLLCVKFLSIVQTQTIEL